MAKLPQEICDQVAALSSDDTEGVPDFKRAGLATISRAWQMAFERQTFKRIRLESTDLESFEKIVTDHRRHFLENLDYSIVLPTYSDGARGLFEGGPDRLTNDEAFTAAIHGLFRFLQTWNERDDGTIQFRIEAVHSPADESRVCRPGPLDVTQFCRYQYSYVRLLRPEELPEISIISAFRTQSMPRALDPRVPIDIAVKLPNLQDTYWHIRDSERRYPALRRRNRHELAQRVRDVMPKVSVLQSLSIFMQHGLLTNHSWHPADLRLNQSALDPLSSALREATSSWEAMRRLSITGTIDESLFWPSPALPIVDPFWQGLKCLDIQFDMTTPIGGWYFRAPTDVEIPPPTGPPSNTKMPPGYDNSEEEDVMAARQFSTSDNVRLSGYPAKIFRSVPDETRLVPLIRAFGQACSQIPGLRVAALRTLIPMPVYVHQGRQVHAQGIWGVWILAPGSLPLESRQQVDPMMFQDVQKRRLFWDVKDWRPDEDLRALLGSVGQDRYGPALVERYVDSWATVQQIISKERLQRAKMSR